MASDSLISLTNNVPDWLKRLDDLNEQIEQRQNELARVDRKPPSPSRSVKNRGSTESLKPKGEGAAILPDADLTADPTSDSNAAPAVPSTPVAEGNPTGAPTPSLTNEIRTRAQRRARAVVQKKVKTESMLSGEGAAPQFRSRHMVIVYYDSWVQSFFEELVKFVSASRNLMRKAKMAAKVAHIKRLAELEMPEDDDDSDSDELKPGDSPIRADPKLSGNKPKAEGMEDFRLRYMATRGLGPSSSGLMNMRRGPGPQLSSTHTFGGGMGPYKQGNDIYDELDRGLDYVQGMCEHAAHQFLREGDCAAEVDKIKDRLSKTRDIADKEMERLAEEFPNGLGEPAPMNNKPRSFRPVSMGRETPVSRTKRSIQSGVLEVDDEGVSDVYW